MAVQKSRVTRSRRGMRRAHDALTARCVSTDVETGERHLRHHVSPDGFYRGREIVAKNTVVAEDQE